MTLEELYDKLTKLRAEVSGQTVIEVYDDDSDTVFEICNVMHHPDGTIYIDVEF